MKRIDVEDFLRWAYRDELPLAERAAGRGVAAALGYGGGWDAVARQGELMTEAVRDGRPNAFGVLPLDIDLGRGPHPDALACAAAVAGLDGMAIDMPEGWSPLGDLALTEAEAAAAVARARDRVARLGRQAGELLRRFAILGGAPDWEAETPVARPVMAANGREAWFRSMPVEGPFGLVGMMEVEGYDRRNGRPFEGAYRKTWLDPDPMLAVVDRAEYEVWHAALGAVRAAVAGRLVAHDVCGPTRAARPWVAERGAAGAMAENFT